MVRKRKREKVNPMPAEMIEAPSIVRPYHAQDRTLSTVAGSKKGYRNKNEHPLTAAFDSNPPKIASDEFAAGEIYRSFYAAMFPAGRDSTQLTVVAGSGQIVADINVDASRAISAIERRLSNPWKIIVQKFCGEGHSARQACCDAGLGDPRETWANIRLALSKLSTAIEGVKLYR